MTDAELTEIAFRAVAADLDRLLHDQRDIIARVSSGSEARFIRNAIRAIVEGLQDRLDVLASDDGIDLWEPPR